MTDQGLDFRKNQAIAQFFRKVVVVRKSQICKNWNDGISTLNLINLDHKLACTVEVFAT